MEKGEIVIKRFTKNNSALAGVIEALLLVALVAIILSIIQMMYIPDIMSVKESEHMDVVENQFSNLKSTIELQSMMGAVDSDNPAIHSMLSSPITLGSGKLPYFVTLGARGNVQINDIEDCDHNKIIFNPMTVAEYNDGIPLTSVEYTAYNHYYLDGKNIKYILEAGAILLNQSSDGEVMKVGPAISVQNISGDIKIYWDIPVFICAEGKDITPTDFKNCYIRTNYTDHDPHNHDDSTSIKIVSEHYVAWYEYFTSNINGLLYEYLDKYVLVDIVPYDDFDPGSALCVRIRPKDTYDLRVAITIVKIGIQTGAGVIQIS